MLKDWLPDEVSGKFLPPILERKLFGQWVHQRQFGWYYVLSTYLTLGFASLMVSIFFFAKNSYVPPILPRALFVLPGLLTPFFYRLLNRVDGRQAVWGLHVLYHWFSTGSLLVFLLYAPNYFWADPSVDIQRHRILRVTVTWQDYDEDADEALWRVIMQQEKEQYLEYAVEIDLDGRRKKIRFSDVRAEEMKDATYVLIFFRKGFWGFDFIDNYGLE